MREKLIASMNRLYPLSEAAPFTDPWAPVWKHGREREALLYALLYLPEFTEVEGSVLQTSFEVNKKEFPQSFIDAKRKGKHSLSQLEESFNYVETSYIFGTGNTDNHFTDEDDKLIAECMAEAWRGRLALLYPTRRFKVSVVGPPESGDAYAITFHEVR